MEAVAPVKASVKGTLNTFFYLVTSQIILLLLIIGYSGYMLELNCPEYDALIDQFESVPYNQTSPVTALSNTWAVLSLLFSGCGGIPWWIYLIVFVPSLIAIVVYVTPFIGGS